MSADTYLEFLKRKICLAPQRGFDDVTADELPAIVKPHQSDVILWAVRKGSAAIFAAFGLGKTIIQLLIVHLILKRTGGRGLIVIPLGVRQEFIRDAAKLGIPVRFIRSIEEADETGIYLTNYETVRDGKLDPGLFMVASLDEAAVLRSFGSKTFGAFLFGPFQKVPHRFVATATPDPNDYIELLGYAQFLDVMDIGQCKTRFFKRDSENADNLTLHAHKAAEYWLWVSSWAAFVQKPSDLGHSDEGYELPELVVRWHEIPSDHKDAGADKSGQQRLYKSAAYGVSEAAREKRDSLDDRVAKLLEIIPRPGGDQFIVWCDLNDEQDAVEGALDGLGIAYSSLTGSQPLEERERLLEDFRSGRTQAFVSKPVMYGAGVNLQFCHHAVFLGIGFKYYEVAQAIHRLQRFGQTHQVVTDFIHTEAERPIRIQLEAKWRRHLEQARTMSAIIRKHGLTISMDMLQRSIGVVRTEASGPGYEVVNNDAVLETRAMAADSVDLILTSIPFSSQYEYTPSYNDFGHTDDSTHFWAQMDFLTPELLRVLKPGRDAIIHVKDRVQPGAMTGQSFQSVDPFHCDAVTHFRKHGFHYAGMITVVTDVVRENKQTYRLGWSEQCKDGSRMGAGMPEYVLLFRKAPTGTENGYADVPVANTKEAYSRGRWQVDAHGFWRSSGNRFIAPEDLLGLSWSAIYRLFGEHTASQIYDYEHHVACADALDRVGALPPDFMLLPLESWHPEVWSDITRMQTMNTLQAAAGREKHLCPLQFDIVDRVINQRSMPGERVYDPFGGLMTVVVRAMKLRRRGKGVDLNGRYVKDGAGYCDLTAKEMATKSLLDLIEAEASVPAEEGARG